MHEKTKTWLSVIHFTFFVEKTVISAFIISLIMIKGHVTIYIICLRNEYT